jgi:nitrite reductase (NADH) small subunit
MRIDWMDVGSIDDVPALGARVVRTADGDVAVFRTSDDQIFALYDRCPHKGGPLSEGIVHGRSVTCPLHNWVISLETGAVEGPDQGCAAQIAVSLEGGRILLGLPQAPRVAHA